MMNFLKRAWRYTSTMIVKTGLLVTIFAVVGTFVLTGLSIQTAAEKAEVSARQALGAEVTLRTDVEKLRAAQTEDSNAGGRGFMRRVPLPMTDAQLLLGFDALKGHNLITNVEALADGFTPVTDDAATDFSSPRPGNGPSTMGDVRIQAVTSTQLLSEFQNGTYTLKSGEHITNETGDGAVVIVSDVLADSNAWKLGDTISVKTVDETARLSLKIGGIFQSEVAEEEFVSRSPMGSTSNLMFIPIETVGALQSNEEEGTISEAVYYLTDPVQIESFKQFASTQKVDWDTFKLDANDAAYNQMIGPISNVASFASYIVWIVFIAGALVIALVITLSIKGRRTEMGVLLAIGESKLKLVMQFFSEILIVAVIGFFIASVASPFVAKPISNTLLTQQVEATELQEEQGFRPMGGRGHGMSQANIEPIESLDVTVSVVEQAQLAGLGILLALLSVLVPMVEIIRFRPKQILAKQE
ncbi:MAG: ABC transporter permease [Bacilli bacterium]